MIRGADVILYSASAEADRAFFRDVPEYPFVDAGHDWLIFALPPAELAIHPAADSGAHELYLMCDDLAAFIAQMSEGGITASPDAVIRLGLELLGAERADVRPVRVPY